MLVHTSIHFLTIVYMRPTRTGGERTVVTHLANDITGSNTSNRLYILTHSTIIVASLIQVITMVPVNVGGIEALRLRN